MICCFNTQVLQKFQVPVQEAILTIHYNYIFTKRRLDRYLTI